MNENLIKGFQYLYLSSKKTLDDPKTKGLIRKQCFEFIKTFDNVAKNIENGKILDLEEVLSYGK